ncbi:probable cytochrome P450 4s3 [Hyposmocoma kahamanoa]|uniref:probable cytochrome P450 4s3 n=1 Tax=Hyposmocoma kahamanoa TaxID=1477025 RepID=UPI000E6D8CCB|nr:probable cytochrome P450 4s3 [Hyposmocoma kahamanoa]
MSTLIDHQIENAKRVCQRCLVQQVGPPARSVADATQILNTLEGLLNKYGDYCKFWIGPNLNVCVKNAGDIRLLLTSNQLNKKGPFYEEMKSFIGSGILSGGPNWRNHRKIVTPSYNKISVQVYSKVFNKEARELATVLANKNPKTTFNVYCDVVRFTTQSVCQTLMGLSKEESKNVKRMDEIVALTQSMYNNIFENIAHWWLRIPGVKILTGRCNKEKYYIKLIQEFTSDILERRTRALNESGGTIEEYMGIVDRFILSGEVSDQDKRFEIFTLFTTSQEASAKLASAVLLFLAHLPEWQQKVYNEIMDVLGTDEDVTEDHLKQLHSLDLVYKEALRYLSIAAFIQRSVEKEITINEGKLTLPVGTAVIISIHMLHRDLCHWEEPNKVKPERFLPENVKQRDPNAFVPFSLGAMDCLGRVYATSLIKTFVVQTLRRVQLEADGNIEDLELHVAISVKFAKGYNLRARPRT